MTDYFALLEQPRAAWLDPEQLKQAFHARTLSSHPDAAGENGRFAQENEAYQVLRDTKKRLQHLLMLEGVDVERQSASIPADIAELFPSVAGAIRRTDLLLEKLRSATSGLSRSLLQSERLATRQELEAVLHTVEQLNDDANERLREAQEIETLRELYLRFSYLTRWLAELQEKQLQLLL